MKQNYLEISNPQAGIAASPHLGFAMMANVDVSLSPGVVAVNKKPYPFKPTAKTHLDADYQITFTAATNDVITLASGKNIYNYKDGEDGSATGMAVTISTTGTLPAGLSAGTYYILAVDNVSGTFKLCADLHDALDGTPAVDITDAGTGTHTLSIVKMGQIKHQVKNPVTNEFFYLDANGRVWWDNNAGIYLIAGNTLTNGSGNGLVFWKNHIFVFRDGYIDYLDVSSEDNITAPTWGNGWISLVDTTATRIHSAIVGQDDILYYLDGSYIGSIQEAPGQTFAANTIGTYISSSKALDLPTDTLATCLTEHNTYLAVGCSNGKIYYWDRISSSFNFPVNIGEYVHSIISVNNLIYSFCGYVGNIYVSDSTNVKLFKKISDYITKAGSYTSSNAVYFGNVVKWNNKFLFGVCINHTNTAYSGVWSIDLIDNKLVAENIGSSFFYLNTPPNVFEVDGSRYAIGYKDSTEAGLMYLSLDKYHTDGSAFVESMLYTVGNFLNKKTYQSLLLELSENLATGESITFKWRKSLTDSWSTIGTISYTTYEAISSMEIPATVYACETLQIRAELTAGTSSPSLCKLRRIILL